MRSRSLRVFPLPPPALAAAKAYLVQPEAVLQAVDLHSPHVDRVVCVASGEDKPSAGASRPGSRVQIPPWMILFGPTRHVKRLVIQRGWRGVLE